MSRAILLLLASCSMPFDVHALQPHASPCARACANVTRLRCGGYTKEPGPDGKYDTADDVPCLDACMEHAAEADDPQRAYLEAVCLAAAVRCEEAAKCLGGEP